MDVRIIKQERGKHCFPPFVYAKSITCTCIFKNDVSQPIQIQVNLLLSQTVCSQMGNLNYLSRLGNSALNSSYLHWAGVFILPEKSPIQAKSIAKSCRRKNYSTLIEAEQNFHVELQDAVSLFQTLLLFKL